jgi:hypothetical protein
MSRGLPRGGYAHPTTAIDGTPLIRKSKTFIRPIRE